MKVFLKLFPSLLCAAVVALAVLAPAELPAQGAPVTAGMLFSVEATGSYTHAEIDALGKHLFEGYAKPVARYPVDTFRLRFSSTDYDGSGAVVTAQLFVPRYPRAARRPVLVFGAGTTGIGDACAPSLALEPNLGHAVLHYRANMLAYAGQGFITILPDYIGFDDPDRPQRYFSKLAEGHVMLDAARAVYRFFEGSTDAVRPMRTVFTAGYSQGGHAAFSAADLRDSYAPDIPLAGMVGFGSTNNVESLLREGTCYGPLVIYTYSVMYGRGEVDPSAYLLEHFAVRLEADLNRMCVEQFQAYYGFDGTKVYAPAFHRALYAKKLPELYPSLARRLAENASGLGGHGLPALIVQGESDFIVTPATQERFVEALRGHGSAVTYKAFKGVPHKGTRQAGFRLSVDWMEAVARGESPSAAELP